MGLGHMRELLTDRGNKLDLHTPNTLKYYYMFLISDHLWQAFLISYIKVPVSLCSIELIHYDVQTPLLAHRKSYLFQNNEGLISLKKHHVTV
jgi:hypothetical protein